jgi:hypothetical protein
VLVTKVNAMQRLPEGATFDDYLAQQVRITEMNRIGMVLFDMNNRIFGP